MTEIRTALALTATGDERSEAGTRWCWHRGSAEARLRAKMPDTPLAVTWRDGEHGECSMRLGYFSVQDLAPGDREHPP